MGHKECLEYIKELNTGIEKLRNIKSLNGQTFTLNTCQKIVFEDGNYIYRVETLRTAVSRIMLYEYFLEKCGKKYNPFLKEELVYYQFAPFEIAVTKQRKIKVKEHISEEEFFNNLSEDTVNLLKDFNIRFFNDNNVGVDGQNKLKIFDYVGSIWCEFIFGEKKTVILKNSKGVTFYKKENWL